MLEHLVNWLKQVKSIQEIVLATTVNQTDDPLVEFARQNGISCFRGSEEDVMSRVIGAAESADAEIVIEYFGDANPYFSCREVIELLRSKPDWVAISKNVQRKGAT